MQHASFLENHTAVPIKLNQMFGPSRNRKTSSSELSTRSANGHSRNASASSSFMHSSPGFSSFNNMMNSNSLAGVFKNDGKFESSKVAEDTKDEGSFLDPSRGWFSDHEQKGFDEFLGNTREHVKGPPSEAKKRSKVLKEKLRDAEKMTNQINYTNLRLRRTVREQENEQHIRTDDENQAPGKIPLAGSVFSAVRDVSMTDQTVTEPLQELSTNDLNMTKQTPIKPIEEYDAAINDTTRNEWVDVSSTPVPSEAVIIQPKRRHFSRQMSIRRYSEIEPEPKQLKSFLMDPMTPGILSAYVQTIFNLGLLSIFIYFFYLIISTIRHDINQKVEEYSGDILQDMSQCSHEYVRNNCMPGKRVPALEAMCNNWERCMNQDPAVVGRAKVSAEMFAEIVNSFIEPISIKTMLFIVVLCGGAFFVNNVALSFSARKYLTILQENDSRQPSRAISAPEVYDNRLKVLHPKRGIRRTSRKRTS